MNKLYKNNINYVFILISVMISMQIYADDLSNYHTTTMDWQSKEKDFEQIMINSQFGDLRLIQSNSDQVKIKSSVQILGKETQQSHIRTEVVDGVLNIDILIEDKQQNAINTKSRIDSAVFLPADTKVTISLEKGRLMTKAINNDLTVNSFNSSFNVNSTGKLNLYTQNGDINVKLGTGAAKHSKLKTSKGMIVIHYDLPDVAFDINSHGDITTNDITLLQNKSGKKPHFKMYNNKGEHAVELMTDSGNIQLIHIK